MLTLLNSTFPFGLFIAMVTGLFGASFFMLIQLQQKISEAGLTDARDMWTWPLIVLRCLVGVGAASILYFFFKSGLLAGSLWPELGILGFDNISVGQGTAKQPSALYVPNKDFALLIVWSFVAGYSQTLVPSLLLTTEARQNKTP
jgi:hypothetical protein